MKNFFNFFICCKNSHYDSAVLTLQTKSMNDNQNNAIQNQTNQESIVKTNDNKKNRNNNTNTNTIVSFQAYSPEKHRPSNFSILTVGNIHVKESTISLMENDTELLIGKELKLTGELFWNKEIMIDRLGIKFGKRKKINSENIFGLCDVKDKQGHSINDFIVNYYFNNEEDPSLFSIKFLKSDEQYELLMINKELIIHHLVDYSYFFTSYNEESFSIGKISVKIKVDGDCKLIKVVIKDENNDRKNYSFKGEDLPIVIGRVDSTINISSTSISKNHAIIDYSDDMQMYFIQDMGSTNKTYKTLSKGDKLILKGDMKFKLGETKFNIKEVNPK